MPSLFILSPAPKSNQINFMWDLNCCCYFEVMGRTELLTAPAGQAHFGQVSHPCGHWPQFEGWEGTWTPRAPHSSGEITFPTPWACPEPQGFLAPPQEPLQVPLLQGQCSGHSRVPQQGTLIHGLLPRCFLLV